VVVLMVLAHMGGEVRGRTHGSHFDIKCEDFWHVANGELIGDGGNLIEGEGRAWCSNSASLYTCSSNNEAAATAFVLGHTTLV
jgi:hypothetical protein